ncbi:hypothetical protein ABAC460_09120 [Asticcacaulis sp. AC460]|uniref:cupin domain-containing protein n=1 Tax=Asticcacaulis sp. AC460 TaxID=1282360 RepID=UPI0003C3F017|nr:hypothetical protein [Asticcacaulis sp. AC460]ESQ90305.1 hypothetical protein ABAC460_09120 [Asticcacaulis sp. AC460]
MSEHDDISDSYLAARYALGIASLAEIVSAEARIDADAEFAAEVGRYDLVFSGLEPGVAPIAPPADLWDRIESAIDDQDRSPHTRTIRTAELAWEAFIPGIDRKIVFVDKAAATSGVLYRLAPGASVGNHGHGVIEECLVLEGEIEIDGVPIRAGDMHMAFPEARHGLLSSRHGALVYLRGDLQIQA